MPEYVFLDLVRQHQGLIYRHALYLLNDPDEASDVTQETFIKAWKHADELRSATARSWLLRCANNLCIDLLRRRKFHVRLAKADDGEIEALVHDCSGSDVLQSSNPSPEDLCIKGERQRLVQQAVAQLPLHFRTVVIMREIEGLSFEEIAKTLNQPVGTVKSNVFRARKKLRAMLGSLFER